MTIAQPPSDWVCLARIRRPQGRKGEVFADLLTDFPEKFSERRELWLLPDAPALGSPGLRQTVGSRNSETRDSGHLVSQARLASLTHHWLHKGGIVLHLAGVDSISAAEMLKGLIVAIPRAQRAQLTEDETYISDLIGCTLIDVSRAVPVTIGEIDDVDRASGPAPLLILHGPGGEILIPFAKSYLRHIDLAAKRVEMALPEGLVDLNSFQ